ncbi:hypothetical protein AKJ45_01400 [candidate division MSBL1 archaeon SCGC-AAA261F19]|uniref:2-amino-5-formylamino-6-ribosylaminopyrimidin-4(3H)-one 5'-monophosphate deformylase n=1 Tax=candidate division MSBL1 archaeon SCGC-AAA261F19 TaxID=1698275 RepID=A0A133VAN5_9EURY|nr:hypothetical protein AKJ45_01400 [candidate division MSBL1 archaeon SCGC-AAA261F19]
MLKVEVGVLALGSHQERHGAALPLDTDARIAEYIAREAVKRTGVNFLGVLQSSYELPCIKTGKHQSLGELAEELKDVIRDAKSEGIEGIVLVNAHGGNEKLEERLTEIENKLKVNLIFNSTICKIEGPHSGTGEVSIGAVLGFADKSRLKEHTSFERYPEVGFVGFEELRERYPWAEKHAREVLDRGIEVDESLGRGLLNEAIADVVNDTQRLSGQDDLR